MARKKKRVYLRDARGRFTSKKKSVLETLDDLFASEFAVEDSTVTREHRTNAAGEDVGTWDVFHFDLAESIDIEAAGDFAEMAYRTMVENYKSQARVRVGAEEYDRNGRRIDENFFTITNSIDPRLAFGQVENKIAAMNPRASGAYSGMRKIEFEMRVDDVPKGERKGKRRWKKKKSRRSK